MSTSARSAGHRIELHGGPVKLDVPTDGKGVWPRWIHVASEGLYLGHPSGPFRFDASVFEQLIANFRRLPEYKAGAQPVAGMPGVVPFDWRHASEKSPLDGGANALEAQVAQGWVWELEQRPTPDGTMGLFALSEMLEPARSLVDAGKIAWTSVCVWPDVTDQITGQKIGHYLSSVALTNDPFIRGMVPLQIAAEADRTNKEHADMEHAQLIALMAARLGCAPTAEAVAAAFPITLEKAEKAAMGTKEKLGAIMSALGVTDPEAAMAKIGATMKQAQDLEAAMPELAEMYSARAASEDAEAESDTKIAAERMGSVPEAFREDAKRGIFFSRTGGVELHPLPTGADGKVDWKPLLDPVKRASLFSALRARLAARTTFRAKMGAEQEERRAQTPPAYHSALFQRFAAPADQQGAGNPQMGGASGARSFGASRSTHTHQIDEDAVVVDLSDASNIAGANPGQRAMAFVRANPAQFGMTDADVNDHDKVHEAGHRLANLWREAQAGANQPGARF